MASHLSLNGAKGDTFDLEVLRLEGTSITAESSSREIYKLNRDILAAPAEVSSTVLGRAEYETLGSGEKPPSNGGRELFYLVHPKNSQYRKDLPPYYLTAISNGAIGNIVLQTSKTLLQNREFKALVSVGKTASEAPLFETKAQRVLFIAKSKWVNGGCKWTNADGEEVAVEDHKSQCPRLTVTAPLPRSERDALVALWVLRLWHDAAESRQVKKQGKLANTSESGEALMLTLSKSWRS